MVAGWGYGVSVQKNIRLAAAKAAEKAGTAVNSGEAGSLAEEKDLTSRYIVQYNRGGWGNSDEALSNAAMVEVWAGQGASAAAPTSMTADQIGPSLRRHLGVREGEGVSTDSTYPEVRGLKGWRGLVESIRERCAGAPVAIKLAAGSIERDLEVALDAGFDVIVLDGAQGGTAYSPELTINNFGLPTIYALPRAVAFLEKRRATGKVSLVVSGGLRDSGDILKAIALGADAVYLSQAALAALLYTQLEKLPSDLSPVSMFRYSPDEKEHIDVDKGALSLSRFLQAVGEEIDLGVRLLGKSALPELSPKDLISLTPLTAAATGVPLAVLDNR
jgi:glutamate synthase domain-containing protein 2